MRCAIYTRKSSEEGLEQEFILLEQNDEWAVQRARYMTLETIAPLSEDPLVKLPAVAAA
jgi:hypothetical protein